MYGEEALPVIPEEIPVLEISEIPTAVVEEPEQPAEVVVAPEPTTTQLNQVLLGALQQLNKLQAIISHISQLINTHRIQPLDDASAREWLQNATKLIGELKKKNYTPLTAKKLLEIFSASNYIAQTLDFALRNQLTILPELSELTIKPRMIPGDTDFDFVVEYAQTVEQRLADIYDRANNSGRTFLNKLYGNVTEFNRNYNVSGNMFKLGLLGIGASALIYALPPTFCERIWLSKVQGFIAGKVDFFKGNDALATQLIDSVKQNAQYGILKDSKEVVEELKKVQGINLSPMAIISGMSLMARFVVDAKQIDEFIFSPEPQKWYIRDRISQKLSNIHDYLSGTSVSIDSQHYTAETITLKDPLFDGLKDQTQAFELILEALKNPHTFTLAGIEIPHTILLTGDSGDGKSYLAKAFWGSVSELFNEMGRNTSFSFWNVEPREFLGWGQNAVKRILQQARQHAPCVVFIDEFHLLGTQAGGNAQLLADFLTALDDLNNNKDPYHQIFIIAATNRPDLLDSALMRQGRFGTIIHCQKPTFAQRKNTLMALCKKSAVDASSIDLDLIANLLQGRSFSDVRSVFQLAEFTAKNKAEGLAFEHFYQALNKIVRKLKNEVRLSSQEKSIVATHQAGCALAHLLLETSVHLESVTIQPHARIIREQYDYQAKADAKHNDVDDTKKQHEAENGAVYTWRDNEILSLEDSASKIVQCKLLLAGSVAQNVLLGKVSDYQKHDKMYAMGKAIESLLNGISFYGLSKGQQERYRDKALVLLETCEQEMYELFMNNKAALARLAQALEEKHFIKIDEIKTIIAAA